MPVTIRDVLLAPKTVVLPVRLRTKSNPAHRAWDLSLASSIAGDLAVYFRVNVMLPEDFSVGMRHKPPSSPANVLIRVNGDHGHHKNPDGYKFSFGAHVHMPTQGQLDGLVLTANWPEGPPYAAPLPDATISLRQAWQLLVSATNIQTTQQVENMVLRAQHALGSGQLDFS